MNRFGFIAWLGLGLWACGGAAPGSHSIVALNNFTPGADNDPVLQMALTASADEGGLCPEAMLGPVIVFSDDFTSAPNDNLWPQNAGYAGDFNGDWYTDGTSARVYNPNWGGANQAAPIPAQTGFVKFVTLFPQAGATLTAEMNLAMSLTDGASGAIVVLYYFDAAGVNLGVSVSPRVSANYTGTLGIYGDTIPTGTTRVALVPLVDLGPTEQDSVYIDGLQLSYETAGNFTEVPLLTDDFSVYDPALLQPALWGEFGGDWFVDPAFNHLTLWNVSWNQAPGAPGYPSVETGLVRDIALGGAVAPGDMLSFKFFSATQFTDPTSYIMARLWFDAPTGIVIDSPRRTGTGWGAIDMTRVPIPTGATTVTVTVVAYMGPTETSSLSVDDVVVNKVLGAGIVADFAPDTDSDGIADVCDNCPNVANASQAPCTDPTATVNPGATVGGGVSVGANTMIPADATIGQGTTVGSNVMMGNNVVIGSNVTIGNDVVLGDNVVIENNASLGSGSILGQKAKIQQGATVGMFAQLGQQAKVENNALVGGNLTMGVKAKIEKSTVVGNNATLADGAKIKDRAVVGDQVTLGVGASIDKDTLVGDNVTLGNNAKINKWAQVGSNVIIGDNSKVDDRAVVGNDVIIGNNVTIKKDAVVPDGTVIPDGTTWP